MGLSVNSFTELHGPQAAENCAKPAIAEVAPHSPKAATCANQHKTLSGFECREAKIGQFDLTAREIHDTWTVRRLMGYAAAMGVKIKVSAWQDDGMITCELAD